jgi:hypothetical protein
MARFFSVILLVGLFLPVAAQQGDQIELKITTIKGNRELPKILYLVPWKDIKQANKAEQKLVLHSLFGDLFDPVLPTEAVVSFGAPNAQQ